MIVTKAFGAFVIGELARDGSHAARLRTWFTTGSVFVKVQLHHRRERSILLSIENSPSH